MGLPVAASLRFNEKGESIDSPFSLCAELYRCAQFNYAVENDVLGGSTLAIKDRQTTTMPTTTMKFTDARAHLSQIFNQVAKEETRVLVEKNGVPVGAFISARDLDRLRRFEQQEAKDRAALIESLTAYANAFKDVPEDELEREIASAIEESRAEIRAEKALAASGDIFKNAEAYEREYAKALAVAKRQLRVERERANQE
jgi:prevent-host-death family protein